MAISNLQISLVEKPLAWPAENWSAAAGAFVDFWGVVRGLEDGRAIRGIEYEAHRAMAEHQLRLIGESASEEFALEQMVLRHRIGFVPVAEASLFLRVASGHRQAAFRASQWIVEELKRKAPIWKRPVFCEVKRESFEAKASAL
jgi:molybdopterin synthase catalytic subunit